MRRSRPDLGELDLASEMEATLREVKASLKTIAREMKARGLRQDEPIPADLEAPAQALRSVGETRRGGPVCRA